jgi:hypothetical protein
MLVIKHPLVPSRQTPSPSEERRIVDLLDLPSIVASCGGSQKKGHPPRSQR